MIRLNNVVKVFATRQGPVTALEAVTLEVNAGEFVVVRGPSGCGKTTLLLTIGGMLHPTSGRVTVDGRDVYALSETERTAFRARRIGFIFQMFHLVPYLSVLENVRVASPRQSMAEVEDRATPLLRRLGLSDRLHHRPDQLSAGERQRTAIARALLNQPPLLLADEPTGNLDPENAAEVLEHLRGFHRAGGTVVVVTHGEFAAEDASRVIQLRAGRVVGQEPR